MGVTINKKSTTTTAAEWLSPTERRREKRGVKLSQNVRCMFRLVSQLLLTASNQLKYKWITDDEY